jgi:hypothetical protein
MGGGVKLRSLTLVINLNWTVLDLRTVVLSAWRKWVTERATQHKLDSCNFCFSSAPSSQ